MNGIIDIVRQYCLFIETAAGKTGYAFLNPLRQHLLRLYECSLQFPDEIVFTATETGSPEPDAGYLQQLGQSLVNSLLDSRFYVHIFDPSIETDGEAVTGDLLDDALDIYKDLKHTLLLWDAGTVAAQANAAFNLHFQFIHHWGDHCMNALYAIHYFLQKDLPS